MKSLILYIVVAVSVIHSSAFAGCRDKPAPGVDWAGCLFVAPKYTKPNLAGANLKGISISGGRMKNADFSDADLSKSRLTTTDFSGSNFSGANFEGASLTDIDMTGANLTGANFNHVLVTYINLVDADKDVVAGEWLAEGTKLTVDKSDYRGSGRFGRSA